MNVRQPCVAGSFYPAHPDRLREMVTGFLPKADRAPARAAVAPHAGYVYSGGVAGEVYGRIDLPRDVAILCFNHRGRGEELSVWPEGVWETPLGRVEVAEDLARAVRDGCGAAFDEAGHRGEHSGEVQVPFLQVLRPDVRIAPVSINLGLESIGRIREFGAGLGSVDREFLVVASTDLNHYEPHDETLVKDQYVIDAILALDEEALKRALREHSVSMCGYAPTIATIAFAKARGAREAKLIDHRTSFEVGGDRDRTVGYAGFIIE